MMTVEELLALYPAAQIQETPLTGYFALPYGEQFLVIPEAQLKESEKVLLQQIPLAQELPQQHPWLLYLRGQGPLPDTKGQYRVFQLQLQLPAEFLKQDWIDSIHGMFPELASLFFLDEERALLVERISKRSFDLEELEGVFLTLDSDFDTTTHVFVGSPFESEQTVAPLFKEEERVFQEERGSSGKTVFSFAEVALHYVTKQALHHNPLMQHLRQAATLDDDMPEIIQVLWENQGNISAAAKALFMHRNTLQYRLDRFYQQTGFSLKHLDHLVLLHLLLP